MRPYHKYILWTAGTLLATLLPGTTSKYSALANNSHPPTKILQARNPAPKLEKLFSAELADANRGLESSYDPNAVSNKGAVGLNQMMPETFKQHMGYYHPDSVKIPRINNEAARKHYAFLANYIRDRCNLWEYLTKAEKRALLVAANNGGHTKLRKKDWQIGKMPRQTRNHVKKFINELGPKKIRYPNFESAMKKFYRKKYGPYGPYPST